MKFSHHYTKLDYPVFTTIRKNRGYYKAGQRILIQEPYSEFKAEIVSIRYISLLNITENIANKDADCTKAELIKLMQRFYKDEANDLILITLMKVD